ncbi:hypothetical protein BGE01nite_39180 [Brevifollis gellanilyticus]|uniref:DUF3592 domain-containing protein n=2 Tax=Brevifollis gellanilyticus TaxID=748831 RepID=A0A512MD23_9BACT|nr:DUF3592 domain-containing protein [Brevifollis gellanilyticus]GEP44627.1 hypothetical protein BGE01nite_39180 [Brevifollis gellanilyticus]
MSQQFDIQQYNSPRVTAGLILAGIAMLLLGVGCWQSLRALTRDGQVVEAKVTESQHEEKGDKSTYRLRYAFKPAADGPEVTRNDFLGRKNLWSALPQSDYDAAVKAGVIQVRYVPKNPGNNAPVASLPKPSDIWVMIGGGAFLILIAVIGWFVQKKKSAAAVPVELPDDDALAEVMSLPPMELRAARRTHLLAFFMAGVPLIGLGIFLLQKPGQTLYAVIFILLGLFCHLNVAFIRFFFDGRLVLYTSLMKRTAVKITEVTGAKIGGIPSSQHAVFFFLSTVSRGDVMLNLRLFEKEDAQEFCARLAMLNVLPQVENTKMAHKLAEELYPAIEDSGEEEEESGEGEPA